VWEELNSEEKEPTEWRTRTDWDYASIDWRNREWDWEWRIGTDWNYMIAMSEDSMGLVMVRLSHELDWDLGFNLGENEIVGESGGDLGFRLGGKWNWEIKLILGFWRCGRENEIGKVGVTIFGQNIYIVMRVIKTKL